MSMQRSITLFLWLALLPSRVLGQAGSALTPPSAAGGTNLEVDPRGRREAAERFDRGLLLFDESDYPGALSEFKRACELMPKPLASFNLGLTYAALHRPVEAVDTLHGVLANPDGLSAAQREHAGQVERDQERRIGRVAVVCNVPANISVDGVEFARTPLDQPLRVSQGTHVVSANAPDHLSRNHEITVAGGEDQRLELQLAPTQLAAAQLLVSSPLPAVDVRVDGVSAGRTPLATSIRVEPGVRVVSGHRDGYLQEARELTLPKGGNARVEFLLREDPRTAPELKGQLELQLSEPANVYIDGASRGPYAAPYDLPRGPHRLRLERAGFEPVEREIEIASGQSAVLRAGLVATASTRTAYVASARAQHVRAWVILVSGAIVLAGGAALAAISHAQHAAAVRDYNRLALDYVKKSERACDPQLDKDELAARNCAQRLADAESSANTHATWRSVGFIAGGVGAAALTLGAVLLAAADHEDRYDLPRSAARLSLRGYVARGGGGAFFNGRF